MMKKILLLISLFVMSFAIVAEETENTTEKLDALKQKIKSYFEDMPQLGWRQKLKISAVVKKHRAEIRGNVDELRPIIVSLRKECREVLTHEQLLTMMDLHDETILRSKEEKLSLFLSKINKEERIELANLVREVWRGDVNNLSANLDALHSFKMEKIFPLVQEKIGLHAAQEQQIKDIIAAKRSQIQPLVIKIITQIHEMRQEVKSKLTLEQINFFESKREQIFQDILDFIGKL